MAVQSKSQMTIMQTNTPPYSAEDLHRESELREALYRQTIIENQFIRMKPTERQEEFLLSPVQEILYGGAAGGGKSAGLLMGALQYVPRPSYSALILRRSFADLNLPGALIPLSQEWLAGTGAHWNGRDYQWVFPSGSTINFGYLQNEADKFRYQSSAFQLIDFDELTQFSETQYRYMFSRLRRGTDQTIPLRVPRRK